jgi:2,2-dialkylglycine decarboxylase (pyruvate)
MALSAVMTSDETAAAAEERGFFFTTTHVNDPLTASVGNKVVEIVRRDSLDQRARVLGGRLKAGLQNFMQRYQCIADVRGRGLLLGMQFVEYNGNSAAVMSERVIRTATRLGLLANNSGASLSGGIMRIAPPLTSTEDEIDAGIDILNAALKEVCR